MWIQESFVPGTAFGLVMCQLIRAHWVRHRSIIGYYRREQPRPAPP